MDKDEAIKSMNEAITYLEILKMPLPDDSELLGEIDDIITKINDLEPEIIDSSYYQRSKTLSQSK